MHPTGSFLLSVIERARFLIEDTASDTQYNDQFLARQVIPQVYEEIMSLLKLNAENPILFRYSVPLVAGTEYYILPPAIQQIWRLGKLDATTGVITNDWFPRGESSPMARGWSIEGNMLAFSPIPTEAETWTLWYVPSCDFMCHKGTGVITGTDRDTITLAAAPDLGILDQRPNAYAGAVLRVIHSGVPWQERVIASYDVSTREAVVRIPFDTTNWPGDGEDITYEIAPIAWTSLWNAISLRIAFNIGVARNMSEKKLGLLDGDYRRAIKSIRDKLGSMMGRRTKGFDNQTYDNRDFTFPSPW